MVIVFSGAFNFTILEDECVCVIMSDEFDRVNCFFGGRALADQLEGDEDQHEKYRGMVVGFIKVNFSKIEVLVLLFQTN